MRWALALRTRVGPAGMPRVGRSRRAANLVDATFVGAAHGRAVTAVLRVDEGVDARTAARLETRRAGARRAAADLTRGARRAARTAVLGIVGRVDAHGRVTARLRIRRAGADAGLTRSSSGADDAAGAAVRRIGLRVHASARARGRGRRAGAAATARRADLTGRAGRRAVPAVRRVGGRIDAHAAAKSLSGGAGANTRSAGLPAGARLAATAAVVGVGREVHASASALRLLRRAAAARLAGSGDAHFLAAAAVTAGAAVLETDLRVHATRAAELGARGARALADRADLPGWAQGSAAAAIRGVAARVDTGAAARDEGSGATGRAVGARPTTDSGIAHFVRGARLAALPAVGGILREASAGAAAVGEPRVADAARRAATDLPTGARGRAIAAMVGIAREIHTARPAFVESSSARGRAHAEVANLRRLTSDGAVAAVRGVGVRIHAAARAEDLAGAAGDCVAGVCASAASAPDGSTAREGAPGPGSATARRASAPGCASTRGVGRGVRGGYTAGQRRIAIATSR